MTEAEAYLNDHELKVEQMRDSLFRTPFDKNRISNTIREYQVRDLYIAKFGFAILTEKAIDLIKKYQPLVEVGAGSGYWAYELQRHDVMIAATDPGTGRYRGNQNHWDQYWVDPEKLTGVQAVRKYRTRNLLTVWPDMDQWPVRTLEAFTGRHVIYVGEGFGGCTADDDFHNYLTAHFVEKETMSIPVFWGIHDSLSVWERKHWRGQE